MNTEQKTIEYNSYKPLYKSYNTGGSKYNRHKIKLSDLYTRYEGHWFITQKQKEQIDTNLKEIPWRPSSITNADNKFAGKPITREEAIHNALIKSKEQINRKSDAVGYYNLTPLTYTSTGWWAQVTTVQDLSLGHRPIPHWLPYNLWYSKVSLVLQGKVLPPNYYHQALTQIWKSKQAKVKELLPFPKDIIVNYIFPFFWWREEEEEDKEEASFIIDGTYYDKNGIELRQNLKR